ncbi:hypothetical protein Mapa_008263 [Marchantia paleacea]|nr:hypothetical protein Mapa_008263 [Marchantia paleacea]
MVHGTYQVRACDKHGAYVTCRRPVTLIVSQPGGLHKFEVVSSRSYTTSRSC